MTDGESLSATTREVVAVFADRDGFEGAVRELLTAGFERPDLSLLGSHDSLDVAGGPKHSWRDVLTALVGEIKYEVPLVASGAILLAGGPVAGTIAGLVGAAVGGIAVKEIIDEVTSAPNTEDFARALAAGSVILWVRVVNDERERRAIDILTRHGGANIHKHEATGHDHSNRP